MVRLSLRLMGAAVIACLWASAAGAQTAGGSVTGLVKDASAAVIPGVSVTAVGGGVTKATTTAGDGKFSIDGLADGTYAVTASLLGFRRVTQQVTVSGGAPANAEFTLEALLAEEITVTAMKREGSIQDTPFSIAAESEETLRSRGVDDIEGVARNVGGFSVQNLGPGQSQVAMRGVSSGQIARDQPGVKEQVGAYLDESVISLSLFTPDIDLFDVNRVEVLRGPQGTLFGSGSESGTVRYISNQPELNVTRLFGEVGGSVVDGGSTGGNVKFGFNAPLGDKAAFRGVGYYTRIPGYIDTPANVRSGGVVRPDPNSIVEDVNSGDRIGTRAAIRFQPSERLNITPRLLYQKVEADGWNRIDDFNILANRYTTSRPAVTLGEREQFVQFDEPFSDEFLLGDLNIGYNWGQTALTSVTSYTHRDIDVIRDAGALTSSITGGSIGLPENIYTLDSPLDDATKAKVWTQELRLSGGKGTLHWVGGGFYANTTRDYGQTLTVTGFSALSGIPTAGNFGAATDELFYSRLHYELKQFALFGEATFSVNDQLDITGGLRYYDFKEERTQTFDGIFADPASKPGKIDASGVAPRLIFTYKASGSTNLNAQVSKGFRLGGINDQLNLPLCTPQDLETYSGLDEWKDEKTWNYEIGSKSRLSHGRGAFNIAAFYMDIRDLQATETAGSCSSRVVLNVPKSRSLGAEADFQFTPNEHWDLDVSGSYTDAKIKSTFESAGGDLGIKDGNRLPSVPEFQMAVNLIYQWQVRQGTLGYVSGGFQHVGSRYTQVGDEDSTGIVNLNSFGANTIGGPLNASTFTYDPLLASYELVNARIGVKKERWDLSLYANNLTDERAFLALDRERGTRARVGYLTNQPRTYGITLRIDH